MSSQPKNLEKIALKAGIWFVISNIALKSMTILTTPIFTRLMSTSEYGTVQTFISWHLLLLPIFSLDLGYSVGRAKLDFPDYLQNYIGSMQVLSGVFSLFLTTILLCFLHPLSGLFALTKFETVLLLLYLMAGPAISFYQTGYRYQYQYKQNISLAWYIAISTTILSLALILFVDGNKAVLRMTGVTVPTVLLSVYLWFISWRSGTLKVNREYWKYGLRISLPLILHILSMHILSQSDRILIAKFCGKNDTAFYSLAYMYGSALHVLTTAVSQGWLPWFHDTYFAGRFEEIRKNIKPFIAGGCIISLLCIATAPEAILILGGEKYLNSIPCVFPVVLGVVCQYIYTHYVNIELHLKKTTYVSYGTIFAAVLNISLNILLIPRYGFVAAAYTTLISYMVLMLVHYFITRKILKVHLYNDWFMVGVFGMTGITGLLLVFIYKYTLIRYGLFIAGIIGFLCFMHRYGKFLWSLKKTAKTKAD